MTSTAQVVLKDESKRVTHNIILKGGGQSVIPMNATSTAAVMDWAKRAGLGDFVDHVHELPPPPKKLTKVQRDTVEIIKYYTGMPNEFYMLKGLLILSHVSDTTEWTKKCSRMYDAGMIAARMDVLNGRG